MSRSGVHSVGLLVAGDTDSNDLAVFVRRLRAALAANRLELVESRMLGPARTSRGRIERALGELLRECGRVIARVDSEEVGSALVAQAGPEAERVLVLSAEAQHHSLSDLVTGWRGEHFGDGAVFTTYGVTADRVSAIVEGTLEPWVVASTNVAGSSAEVTIGPVPAAHAESLWRALRGELGEERVARGTPSLAEVVVREAHERDAWLAAAESCTGGRLAAQITSVPGSSAVFWGSLVTYAYEAKSGVLGVDPEDLDAYGAVSERVVVAMARGVRARSGASVAVAVSGIAGPGGGTPEKPVGTVWLACDTAPGWTSTRLLSLGGARERIQRDSVCEALVMMRAALASG
ncbi:MAG: CinA family protein [Spirochaetota bacterium]